MAPPARPAACGRAGGPRARPYKRGTVARDFSHRDARPPRCASQEDAPMMNTRSLGGRADLVQIIEFHGPTHDAQWMLPDAAPPMLAANASWLADQYWMPRT